MTDGILMLDAFGIDNECWIKIKIKNFLIRKQQKWLSFKKEKFRSSGHLLAYFAGRIIGGRPSS